MPASKTAQQLEGVIPVLPVPFSETGSVDEQSFRRVVDSAIQDGVHAVALFGLASEYAKLADEEKQRLTEALVEQASGRIPVIISIAHHSLLIAAREAAMAARRGANAIMVVPPFFLAPSAEAVRTHIGAVAEAVDLPVIVQYAPLQTGTNLAADTIAALRGQYPNVQYVKVDLVPSGPMVTRLQSLKLKSIVGYMGLHLPEDVERGAIAVMPTVSVSRAFVRLWTLLHSDPKEGRRFHQQLLPLLNFMMQSVEMLVAVEKLLLFRRGLIACDHCRAPRWSLDELDRHEIDRLCCEYSDLLLAHSPQTEQQK